MQLENKINTMRDQQLWEYQILDTPPESSYDELVEFVAAFCGVPIALITILDGKRQWFKSKVGTTIDQTPQDIAICAHAIKQTKTFIISDASKDSRFSDNPLVTEDPKIRFYAGIPLIDQTGFALGTLCVIDHIPRILSGNQIHCLEVISRQVMTLLELRRANKILKDREIYSESQHSQTTELLKLKALGEMAGGIAHEINNPMTIIHGRTSHLKEMAECGAINNEKVIQYCDIIISVVARISKIIKGLRSFSRSGEQDPIEEVSISELINDTLEFCREKIGNSNIHLTIEPISIDLKVKCRSVQISQVILNLLINAYDAVETATERWIKLDVTETNNTVEIRVTDSGAGIPKKIEEKIFEPFFSTKQKNKGTGLGLSISRGIAKAHLGNLTLDQNSTNTRFILTIPK